MPLRERHMRPIMDWVEEFRQTTGRKLNKYKLYGKQWKTQVKRILNRYYDNDLQLQQLECELQGFVCAVMYICSCIYEDDLLCLNGLAWLTAGAADESMILKYLTKCYNFLYRDDATELKNPVLIYEGIEAVLHVDMGLNIVCKQYPADEETNSPIMETSILECCREHPYTVDFIGSFRTRKHYKIYMHKFQTSVRQLYLGDRKNPYKVHIFSLFKQLLEAVSFLNVECGIFHRDVKASNIGLVVVNGHLHCKLADFGNSTYNSLTTGLITTNEVRPPEQKEDTTIASDKIDAYSCGMVLMFMILGFYPPRNYVKNAIHGPRMRREVGSHGVNLLSDLCHYDPDKRCTAHEALARLNELNAEATSFQDFVMGSENDVDMKEQEKKTEPSASAQKNMQDQTGSKRMLVNNNNDSCIQKKTKLH